MTKQQEIDLLKGFVGGLGEGYLKDIFADVAPQICDAIRSDFCCVPFGGLLDQKAEMMKEIEGLRKQAADLRAEAGRIEREKVRLALELDKVKQDILKLARSV